MGGNIPVGNFLGGNFLGWSLMGGNFPGGNFPGENFPRTALSLLFLTEALNHRLYDFKFFVNNSFVDSLFYNVNFEIYGIIRRLKLNIYVFLW